MKEMLRQLAVYNVWANQKLVDVILSLSEEHQQQVVKSSFPGLHATLLHMWDAESTWWQRIRLQERIVIQSENFNGNTRDVSTGLIHQSKQWEEWIANASELSLGHVFQYYNLKKEQFKQPVFQAVLHVFNHSTYHRGQLVTILRQLGVEKIPQTDFIVWSRSKASVRSNN